MPKFKGEGASAKSLSSRPTCRRRLLLAIAASLLSAIGWANSKGGGAVDYVEERHRSAIHPLFTYAVYRSVSGSDDSAVLYYFHGSGGDENTWYSSSRGIMDEWKKKGVRPPLVVSMSFGSEWFMFPRELSSRSVSLEAFVRELMPEIEKQIGGKIARRLLFGFSVGGANVAQLLFRYPQLFDRAVIASPMIYPIPIYESDKKIEAFIRSVETTVKPTDPLDWIKANILGHDVIAKMIWDGVFTLRWNVQDPDAWAKADIITNMKAPPKGRRIRVYISCGRQDPHGFYPGAELLEKTASSRGYDAVFDPLEGGHLSLNEPRIADFLAD